MACEKGEKQFEVTADGVAIWTQGQSRAETMKEAATQTVNYIPDDVTSIENLRVSEFVCDENGLFQPTGKEESFEFPPEEE